MKISESPFRAVYCEIYYIANIDNYEISTAPFPDYEKETGVIAYGHIDKQLGFTFEVLGCAKLNDRNKLTTFAGNDNVSTKYRMVAVLDNDVILLNHDEKTYRKYPRKINNIIGTYHLDEALQEVRYLSFLYERRHKDFSDSILVILIKYGL